MTIGGTLAKARQEAGLTVPQVARKTRIRETVIHAIERDDYSMCGGNFYTRGHIRSIARAIGADSEPLVREFDDAHGGSPQAISATQAFEPEAPVRFLERRSPNWSAAMVVALVLVAIYGVVKLTTGSAPHRPVERAAAPATSRPASPAPSHSGAVAQAPRKEVDVRVAVSRASWLNIHDSSGKQLFSGVLRAGQSKEWTSKKRIRVVIGNGGGVRLTVNGKNLGAAGGSGQVVRMNFGPDDPKNG